MYRRGQSISAIAIVCAMAGACVLHATASLAQSPIGAAASTQNQVEGILGGGTRAITTGGAVFQNERVRTGEASQAQLVFLDQTNLGVGPKSEVTLNRFIYNPDRGSGRVAVEASRGVFRFVTGAQDPKNYEVRTPIATIGVRGTEFHLLVERRYIVVALVHGALRVVTMRGRIIVLDQPGTTVTIYADGRVEGPMPWNGPITTYAGDVPFPYFASSFASIFPPLGGYPAMPGGVPWQSGLFLSGSVLGNFTQTGIHVTDAVSGAPTDNFQPSSTAFGGGATIGYAGIPLYGLPVSVTPFVSFDILNQRVSQALPAQNVLGETIKNVLTAGLRIPILGDSRGQLYILGGFAAVEKEFIIRFNPLETTSDQWLLGGTLGLGFSGRVSGLDWLGWFVQFELIWVEDHTVRMPPASPASNFRFENSLNVGKLGVSIHFGAR